MSLWTRGSDRAFSTRGLCGMSQICIATFWKIAYLIAMQCKGEPDMSYLARMCPCNGGTGPFGRNCRLGIDTTPQL